MSFTGDLEYLPIVDVVQLIYSTRKSGTLSIKSPKGASQVVFSEGYFVSANHLNNSVRIGNILVESGHLTQGTLEQALLEQKNAGPARKPLIAMLIEQGAVKTEDAYKGLETLIEMTILEVLTWKSGTFELDVNKTEMNDEYRYFPETLKQEILINAQGILMDALRIYDEKMRDGTLEEIFFSSAADEEGQPPVSADGNPHITADLLGLEAIDSLTKQIPDVFIGLKTEDHSGKHRRVISTALGALPPDKQELLCSILTRLSVPTSTGGEGTPNGALPLAVIIFSRDPFITHAISTICRQKNHVVFTTEDDANLDMIIEQSFSRDLLPLLIMDDARLIGGNCTEESLAALLQQKRDLYPRIAILQMCLSPEDRTYPPHVLDEGTEAIFPRPVLGECADSFVSRMAGFFESLNGVLEKSFAQTDRQAARKLRDCVTTLAGLSDPQGIARELLKFSAGLFERSMILVAGASELTAEKGIGVTADRSAGPTGPLMYRVPLSPGSLCRNVLEKRRMYFGLCSDETLTTHLYDAIPAPHSPKVLLLPLLMSGNVFALVYADFGQAAPSPVKVEYLEVLSRVAGLVLDYSSCQKKFERLTQTR